MAEQEASHTAAKLGPYTASTSGAVTKDDPNRSQGAWNQTVGSGKEFVGGLIGSEVRTPAPFQAVPIFPSSFPEALSQCRY